MLKRTIKLLQTACMQATKAAAAARITYQGGSLPFTWWIAAQCWMEGLFVGLAASMAQARQMKSGTNPDYSQDATFSPIRGVLLVELTFSNGRGTATPVVSTLSHAEAMTVLTALRILRGTGLYSLTVTQAQELIRSAEQLGTSRAKTSPNSRGKA